MGLFHAPIWLPNQTIRIDSTQSNIGNCWHILFNKTPEGKMGSLQMLNTELPRTVSRSILLLPRLLENNQDTVYLVAMMFLGVASIFASFAAAALCYRSNRVFPQAVHKLSDKMSDKLSDKLSNKLSDKLSDCPIMSNQVFAHFLLTDLSSQLSIDLLCWHGLWVWFDRLFWVLLFWLRLTIWLWFFIKLTTPLCNTCAVL
jgi:hypothetical protein